MDDNERRSPEKLAEKIKGRISRYIGPFITCSIGFAANRHLAKIAGKQNKPDGVTIWHPDMMPGPLLSLPFSDIPGIGNRMELRLLACHISNMQQLLKTSPKQLRKIWNNVIGERLWYALHGYDIQAEESKRGMFGHGRVLPPDSRYLDAAYDISRLLLTKAARRLRRESFYCSGLWLWLSLRDGSWGHNLKLPIVHDDQAILGGLRHIWKLAQKDLHKNTTVFRVHVALYDLSPSNQRQLDMFLQDNSVREKAEALTKAIDFLNKKYSKTVVSYGVWNPPEGGNVGGKISYTRIPRAEDFW